VTPPGAFGDEAVRALAREIVAREDYARFRPLDAEWLARLLRRLADLIVSLSDLWETDPALYVLLVLGLAALAAALIAHVVWSVRRALSASVPAAPRPAAPRLDLAADAAALARDGRLLEAAHALQLACLEALVRGGALELRRHEPNQTLRERLARSPLPDAERREFLALLGRLETRWFRDRAAGPDDGPLFEAWRALHDRLAPGLRAP
jgi:hypothetical protein